MANYKITFKSSVAKDLRNISNTDVERILNLINELAENPRAPGCIKLSGHDLCRVRQGNYRIVHEIRDGELVVVIKVAHRSSVYGD
jgi:mRNA interferase RelE/StbE